MTKIFLYATDQLLSVSANPTIAAGDVQTVEVHIDFSEEWDGLARSAVFFTAEDQVPYEMVLNKNGECVIPHEVLAEAGTLYIGVRGVNADEALVKTSTLVKYKIKEGAPAGEGTTVEPTPDVYQQLLTLCHTSMQELQELFNENTENLVAQFEAAMTEVGLTYELLWENPDPSVPFAVDAAANVALGADVIGKYDSFCITYKWNTSNAYDQYYLLLSNRLAPDGNYVTGVPGGHVNCMVDYTSLNQAPMPIRRQCMVALDKSYIYIGKCISVLASDKTDYSAYLVPGKIYGIKENALLNENVLALKNQAEAAAKTVQALSEYATEALEDMQAKYEDMAENYDYLVEAKEDGGDDLLTKVLSGDDYAMHNSKAGGIKLLSIDGKTEQDGTSGAQLAKSVYVGNSLGIYAVALRLDAELKPSTTYTITFNGTVGNGYYTNEALFTNSSYMTVENGLVTVTCTTKDTLPSEQYTEGSGWIILKNSKENSTNSFTDVMLNAGSTALPWEPYTGGQPSPNPEYPQEIRSVVVNEVKARGTQLFDTSKLTAKTQGSVTVSFENGKIITSGDASNVTTIDTRYKYSNEETVRMLSGIDSLTLSVDELSNAYPVVYLRDKDSNEVIANCSIDSSKTVKTLDISTVDLSKCVLQIGAYMMSSQGAKFRTAKVMLNAGTEALPWEEYRSNSITLSQPIELNGIGDVMDELTPDGVVRKVAKYNGSWSIGAISSSSSGQRLTARAYDMVTTPHCPVLCSHAIFAEKSPYNTVGDYIATSEAYNNKIDLRFSEVRFASSEEVNAWIEENNVETYYQLATPITEPLPTADQIALRSLLSYDGVTYLETSSLQDALLEPGQKVQPTITVQYGTSAVGALALENRNLIEVNEILAGGGNDADGYLTKDNFSTLVAEGEVSTLQSAIQITNATLFKGATFTGSGRGKLFVQFNYDNYGPTIKIDGTDIGVVRGSAAGTTGSPTVEIEFLSSFEVKAVSNTSDQQAVICNAVFY